MSKNENVFQPDLIINFRQDPVSRDELRTLLGLNADDIIGASSGVKLGKDRLSVLISIQPKWCEKIARGEKTVEIRKNRPKLETPFKCYIYRTKGFVRHLCGGKWFNMPVGGTVIGEFTCKQITPLHNICTDDWSRLLGDTHEWHKGLVKKACLTEADLKEYAKGKGCYAWNISDLRLYDKPRQIGSFWVRVTNKVWSFKKKLERAPQSWCYVDEE